jgi:hypothetical protein
MHSGLTQYCGKLCRLLRLDGFRMFSGDPAVDARRICSFAKNVLKSEGVVSVTESSLIVCNVRRRSFEGRLWLDLAEPTFAEALSN